MNVGRPVVLDFGIARVTDADLAYLEAYEVVQRTGGPGDGTNAVLVSRRLRLAEDRGDAEAAEHWRSVQH